MDRFRHNRVKPYFVKSSVLRGKYDKSVRYRDIDKITENRSNKYK